MATQYLAGIECLRRIAEACSVVTPITRPKPAEPPRIWKIESSVMFRHCTFRTRQESRRYVQPIPLCTVHERAI